jgi:hypothetical protein
VSDMKKDSIITLIQLNLPWVRILSPLATHTKNEYVGKKTFF